MLVFGEMMTMWRKEKMVIMGSRGEKMQEYLQCDASWFQRFLHCTTRSEACPEMAAISIFEAGIINLVFTNLMVPPNKRILF
jgi:hypothetical protein